MVKKHTHSTLFTTEPLLTLRVVVAVAALAPLQDLFQALPFSPFPPPPRPQAAQGPQVTFWAGGFPAFQTRGKYLVVDWAVV